MFRILPVIFAGLTFTTSAAAQSSAPFSGTVEKLFYVSETQFPGADGMQSLCIRASDQYLAFLPIKRTTHGYAFSENSCAAAPSHAIPEHLVAKFKRAGILPAETPDVPTQALMWTGPEKGRLLFLCMALFGLPLFLRRRMRIKSRRAIQNSSDPMFYDVLLTLMFHTARTDGVIDQEELQAIIHIYKELTGASVTPEMTAEKFALSLKDDGILHLAKGYRGAEAKLLIDAAIKVATFRGSISREKLALLNRLNGVLERDQGWLRQTLETTLRPTARKDRVEADVV